MSTLDSKLRPHSEYPRDRCRADDKVRCADGSIYICADQKCDGKWDCPGGADEANCTKNGLYRLPLTTEAQEVSSHG